MPELWGWRSDMELTPLENQLRMLHMEEIQRELPLSGDTNRKKDRVAADRKRTQIELKDKGKKIKED